MSGRRRRRVKLTLVTANIGRKVSSRVAAANMRRVIAAFVRVLGLWWRRNVVLCLQEIDDDDAPPEYRILRRLLRRLMAGFDMAGADTATPIVVPRAWRLLQQKVRLTSKGRAGATPHRVCVAALIENRRTGIRVLVLNGHWPRDEIADLWRDCEHSWEAIYATECERGYPILSARDRNKAFANRLHPTERSLLAPRLIDQITVTEGHGDRRCDIKVRGTKTVRMSIDGHDAHGVALELTATREKP